MNQHQERPGKGVMYFEEGSRLDEKKPKYKGYIILEMDYKAGEKLKIACWERPTSRGYSLLSLAEDNYSKKKEFERNEEADIPKEVKPSYRKKGGFDDDDNSVPF